MTISNVELLLLEIIEKNSEISGYEINRFIEENGYRAWTDIAMTSIYSGLDKLKAKELAFAYLETKKTGKGPLPNKYRITVKGRTMLKDRIKNALSESKIHDRAFDIGLAGLSCLTKEEVLVSLKKRIHHLNEDMPKITTVENEGKSQSRLFQYPKEHHRFLFEKEIEYTKHLITQIKQENI